MNVAWFLTLTGVAIICGCATTPEQRSTSSLGIYDPAKVHYPRLTGCSSGASTTTMQQAIADFDKALKYCGEMQSYYANSAQAAGQRQFYLGLIGSISGGVIAPAFAAGNHAKSVIAGFSGISGAVNAAQADLNSNGLGRASVIAEQRNLSSQISTIVARNAAITTAPEMCAEARKLLGKCVAMDTTGAAPEAKTVAAVFPASVPFDAASIAAVVATSPPAKKISDFMNMGQAAITITADVTADVDQFIVDSTRADSCRKGLALAPGKSCVIYAAFSPKGAPGDKAGRITVISDAADGGAINVNVTGKATP